MKVLLLLSTQRPQSKNMEIIEYATGKGGIMILGLIAVVVFVYRKYKEKRYFKDIEKRINKRDQRN